MKTHHTTHEAETAHENLSAEAQELIAATAHVAGEKVEEARRRLLAALAKGRETWKAMQDKAIAGAKATDEVIRENPYKSLAVALGAGVIIGYLLRRRD